MENVIKEKGHYFYNGMEFDTKWYGLLKEGDGSYREYVDYDEDGTLYDFLEEYFKWFDEMIEKYRQEKQNE